MATKVAELRLKVRIDEGSGPVVVLLHGINSTADDMRPLVALLTLDYRVIAPDLLGFGGSPKPLDIDYTTDEHVAVLAATLDDLDLPGRFLLLGYSLGGDIAARYAAHHPERVRRLFLLSTPFYLPPENYVKHRFGTSYVKAVFWTWLWRVIGDQKQRNTPFYALAAGPLRGPVEEYIRAEELPIHWEVMARTLQNTITATTLVDDLPKLTMPTTFALGVKDPLVRPYELLGLQRLKPDLDVRRIGGLTADHLLIVNVPDRVAEEVRRAEENQLSVGLRTGAGEPLVLLPDLGNTWRIWQDAADNLAADHEVVVLDLLGFGDSPAPTANAYSLEDHAGAVLATARIVFGDRRFTVAGTGFGADVALACAAIDPQAVAGVVALAPPLPTPDASGPNPAYAGLLASRDAAVSAAGDERFRRAAGGRLESELLATVRSVDRLAATDARQLMSRLAVPVRFVMPEAPGSVPGWLTSWAASEPERVALERCPVVPGPGENSRFAVSAIRGEALPQPAGALTGRLPAARRDPLSARLGRVNVRMLLRSVVPLLVGVPLLVWPGTIPVAWVAVMLAIWLAAEAVHTLVGAIAELRRGQPWLVWAVLAAVAVVCAVALAIGNLVAIDVARWIVVVVVGLRGLAQLIAAATASSAPVGRGVLVLDGLLSLAIAVAMIFWPPLGNRLLRYTIGGYLAATGIAGLAAFAGSRRAARARLRHYLYLDPAP
ncbi:MAG: alpha/beta hydrolase [Propionicimonas sp.]|uniref:alpha/beta fold hydrolase n=1 Tax=Propionicimonas sp. TaxID=1955623 RepID=UPI003D140121